jgi:hypothetical protein
MSSYELLELLEFVPENDAALSRALRGGEYSETELTLRHLTNEVARLRATMHAVHGGQRYDPPLLLSKSQQQAEVEDAEAAEERREDFFAFADRSQPELTQANDDDLIEVG